MKRIPRWLITISLLVIFFFAIPSFLYAGPGDPNCDPLDPACPIDGGVVALLVTGAGYGIKKVIETKNKV